MLKFLWLHNYHFMSAPDYFELDPKPEGDHELLVQLTPHVHC